MIQVLFSWGKMDYGCSRWKKKREHILRLDGYRCQIAKRYGRNEEATIVHHIYPAKEYPEYEWEDWNLISVSASTHNLLENRNTGELTKMGEALKRRTKPGINWRKKERMKKQGGGTSPPPSDFCSFTSSSGVGNSFQ